MTDYKISNLHVMASSPTMDGLVSLVKEHYYMDVTPIPSKHYTIDGGPCLEADTLYGVLPKWLILEKDGRARLYLRK